jgi:predicted enzyme related to lactoylglutathione lyase
MLNVSSIMIGSSRPKELAEFYEKVFGKKPDMTDGSWFGWQSGTFFFNIGEHSEVKEQAQEPQRVIFNLETKEVKEEFERIKDIPGAKVIKEPYTMEGWEGVLIATFADPDGNYFQLMPPWDDGSN